MASIDFSIYIDYRTRDFTGREWVFKAIDNWLAASRGLHFFLLTGEPSSGKTAIAARLTQFSQGTVSPPEHLSQLVPAFLSAVHFCSARDRRWINPHVFAESLALQLAARYPAYAQALAEKSGDRHVRIEVEQRIHDVVGGQVIGVLIKKLDLSGVAPEDAFIRVVREPLEALFQAGFGQSVIILVDGLDEALTYSGDIGIVPLLAEVAGLPDGLRFILTSRRDERVENAFLEAKGLFLSAGEYTQRHQEDIGGYVQKRLQDDEGLAARTIQLSSDQLTECVDTIAHKADGNFQYVTFLLDAMARGQRSPDDLEGLPAGLDGLYYESLGRVVKLGSRDWSRDYSPLMGVLSVAQESLTLTQLQAFTGQHESVVWEYLGDLQQFIEGEQQPEAYGGAAERYRLYHQSVIDFLRHRTLVVKKKTLRNSQQFPESDQTQ